jgi:myo-inositol-1(or 4)-monophosphatase
LYQEIYRQALHWVDEARDLIHHYLQRGHIHQETKSRYNDLVTEVDRAVEKLLVNRIQEYYPEHQIIGEEGTVEKVTDLDGFVWYIDPIDGTSNFITQQIDFTISVALYHNQEALFGIIDDVARQERYHAYRGTGLHKNQQPLSLSLQPTRLIDSIINCSFHFTSLKKLEWGKKLLEIGPRVRGIRYYGAASLSLLRVALGQNQGYLVSSLNPWDFAAGKLFVEEAGGIVTNFSGQPVPLGGERTSLIAANPSIHEDLLTYIQQLPPSQQ